MGLLSFFVKDSEINSLRKQVDELIDQKQKYKVEIEELKLKKRLENEEIKHMVRINEERMEQEVTSKKIELEKKYHEDISKFKEQQRQELVLSLKEFHSKIENRFNSELENLKETYKAIMARLPNVNLTLEKRLK